MKEGQQGSDGIKRADLLQMYYYLRLTRTMEDRITALYRQGRIVGGGYTRNRIEAVAIGYAPPTQRGDIIPPLHPGNGALLLRRLTPGQGVAQLSAKDPG